jgi:hypothetical protein
MDVDEKKRRNAMIFDRMAAEASRSVVYRDTIIEVDSLITDLLELEGTYYGKGEAIYSGQTFPNAVRRSIRWGIP